MFLEGYPQSPAAEVIVALFYFWGKPPFGAQTGQVEQAANAYAAMKNAGRQDDEQGTASAGGHARRRQRGG